MNLDEMERLAKYWNARGLKESTRELSRNALILIATLREAQEIAGQVREYMDGRADAQYFTDSPTPLPNEEMRLLVAIDEWLARFKDD